MENDTIKRTFPAQYADGTPTTVVQVTDIKTGHSSSGTHRVEGPSQLTTIDGQLLNWIRKGEYAYWDNPEIVLTSSDSRAP